MAGRLRVEVAEEAYLEIIEAREYMRLASESQSIRFAQTLDRLVSMLQEFPAAGRLEGDGIRAFVMQGFPYILVYRATEQKLRLLGLIHTSRGDQGWRARP